MLLRGVGRSFNIAVELEEGREERQDECEGYLCGVLLVAVGPVQSRALYGEHDGSRATDQIQEQRNEDDLEHPLPGGCIDGRGHGGDCRERRKMLPGGVAEQSSWEQRDEEAKDGK